MDGIPGGTGTTEVPFDWIGDGLPMLLVLLLALCVLHRIRNRAPGGAVTLLSRRRWRGFATALRRGRSPA
jgi:hypothetical protein